MYFQCEAYLLYIYFVVMEPVSA